MSTVSHALIAAAIFPVCPTISGLAKFKHIKSAERLLISFTIESFTSTALISGCRSYVATFGEGHKILFSFLKGSSLPPLKKKVTCGYFSVSAILIWLLLFFSSISPKVSLIFSES